MMMKKKALVVGASGGIGQNLIQHLSNLDGWDIVGLARKDLPFASRAQLIAVDLSDRDRVQAQLKALTDITHVFYTAFYEGV